MTAGEGWGRPFSSLLARAAPAREKMTGQKVRFVLYGVHGPNTNDTGAAVEPGRGHDRPGVAEEEQARHAARTGAVFVQGAWSPGSEGKATRSGGAEGSADAGVQRFVDAAGAAEGDRADVAPPTAG